MQQIKHIGTVSRKITLRSEVGTGIGLKPVVLARNLYLNSDAAPNYKYTRDLQKVLSLGSDCFSATFYQTYFYYKPSKYSLFTETHFCKLFIQSRKADK